MAGARLEEGWGSAAEARAAARRLQAMGLPGELCGPAEDPRLAWDLPAGDPETWSLVLHVARPAALDSGPSALRTLTVDGVASGALAERVALLLALCVPPANAETLLVAVGSTAKRRHATVVLPSVEPGLLAALVAWAQAAAAAESPGTSALVRQEGRAWWLRGWPGSGWARQAPVALDGAEMPAQRALLRQLTALEARVEEVAGSAVRQLLEDHLLGIYPLPCDAWPGGPLSGGEPWGPP